MYSCYECCCLDSIDNPIIGIEDMHGVVSEWICSECYAAGLPDENSYSDD
jgi:formylglycine-generating enzyme required for sulfatase activity